MTAKTVRYSRPELLAYLAEDKSKVDQAFLRHADRSDTIELSVFTGQIKALRSFIEAAPLPDSVRNTLADEIGDLRATIEKTIKRLETRDAGRLLVQKLIACGYLYTIETPAASAARLIAGRDPQTVSINVRGEDEDNAAMLAFETSLPEAIDAAARTLRLVQWSGEWTRDQLLTAMHETFLERYVEGEPLRFSIAESVCSGYLRSHPGADRELGRMHYGHGPKSLPHIGPSRGCRDCAEMNCLRTCPINPDPKDMS